MTTLNIPMSNDPTTLSAGLRHSAATIASLAGLPSVQAELAARAAEAEAADLEQRLAALDTLADAEAAHRAMVGEIAALDAAVQDAQAALDAARISRRENSIRFQQVDTAYRQAIKAERLTGGALIDHVATVLENRTTGKDADGARLRTSREQRRNRWGDVEFTTTAELVARADEKSTQAAKLRTAAGKVRELDRARVSPQAIAASIAEILVPIGLVLESDGTEYRVVEIGKRTTTH